MLKVGVTGGIGSGKSFVCKIFRLIGIPVFNADEESKTILQSDLKIKSQLIEWFGSDIYLTDGTIHRKKLASIIFNDKIALQKVNSIVHPAVRKVFHEWCKNVHSPYVIQEAAILFESGENKNFDRIITVVAPVEERIQRVLKRDGTDRNSIEARMKNQLSDDIRIKNSQYIIYADDNHLVIPQVVEIDKKLREIWQNLENG